MAGKREHVNASNLIKPLELDNMFASTDPESSEVVSQLSLIDLYPFKDHHFKPYSDDKMAELVESIKKDGVIVPIIVRRNPYGDGYEIISGHNRVEGSRRAKLTTINAIIKDWDDVQATIFMVNSNFLQREKLFPSELAFGYKQKLEALKSEKDRVGRPKDNPGQDVLDYQGKQSREILGDMLGVNYKQIQRYIRLTNLTPELLDYVDGSQLSLMPAVHLSFLPTEEQNIVREIMERETIFPSTEQAKRLHELSKENKLDWSAANAILTTKKPEQKSVNISGDRFSKFFPKNLSSKELEDSIYKIVEHWYRTRNQEKTR